MMELEINVGDPKVNGIYVCYVELARDAKFPEKKLLTYFGDTWGFPGSDQNFRGEVYGWIGPLPAPTVESLEVLASDMYGVTKGRSTSFLYGPTSEKSSLGYGGERGNYIARINVITGELTYIHRWNSTKDAWVKIAD